MAASLFCSCTGGTVTSIGATRGIETLEDELERSEQAAPSVDQYLATRAEFLKRMSEVLAEQERKTGSKARKIKNIIAIAGVTVGLGGTIAGLFVDDDDTKATISQASAGVAGVSGVLGLLPLGSVPKGAESIQQYLKIQMPAFEQRWPDSLDEPLEPAAWKQFTQDARQMERVVEALRE
jgi:hypothetical protein